MIFGILADTHDNLPKLKKALALFKKKNVSVVIHAGDYVAPFSVGMLHDNVGCDYYGVFGNNDGEREGITKRSQGKIKTESLELTLFEKKIFVIHDLAKASNDLSRFDFVISGHTHTVDIQQKQSTWMINPGECCGWLHGESTVVTFDVISNSPKVHRI